MSYSKTEWVDGENKYSLTDQAGNVIPGFENIKLLYTGTGGTPLSSEKMNNIEDGLTGVIAESYRTNAEQNVQLWELEASVIQDKENMAGWQGEGFFANQDEVVNNDTSNMTILRGVKKEEGSALFGSPTPETIVSLPVTISAQCVCVAYSNSSQHVIAAVSAAVGGEYILAYKRDGIKYTPITFPSTSTLGVVNKAKFSSDDQYLALAHSASPFVSIYKRNGDTFTKIANPATLPTGPGRTVEWSVDGTYLVVGQTATPFITIYKRNGDVFTKLANPSVLPPNRVDGLSFSPDGTYLCVTGAPTNEATNYTKVYKRTLDVFTSLTFPQDFGYYAYVQGAEFSPDGNHLVLAGGVAPYVAFYKRVGDTFTKLPITIGTTNAPLDIFVTFSPDGKYVIAGRDIYKHSSGDTFSLVGQVSTSSQARGAIFTPDGAQFHFITSGYYLTHYACTGVSNTPTTGSITLKTVTLPEVSNSVFILDKVSLATGVSRVYEISLNGGVTWQTITSANIGDVVKLNHSGNQLTVRLRYTRNVSGSGIGKVYWLAVWAGAV